MVQNIYYQGYTLPDTYVVLPWTFSNNNLHLIQHAIFSLITLYIMRCQKDDVDEDEIADLKDEVIHLIEAD